jgi:riboflavin kinase
MTEQLTVTGRIISGEKRGASLTQIEWVRKQCGEVIGANPFPGTLNIEVAVEKALQIEKLLEHNGVPLVSPDRGKCAGFVYPVSIMGVSGAIIAVTGDNRINDENIVELFASAYLKDALDVDDGDEILFVAQYPLAP